MKLFKIIFLTISLLFMSGCIGKHHVGKQTYERFAEFRNLAIGGSHIPNMNQHRREVYSEDKYIYKFETPPKCFFGCLTNKDDKPEKVIDWVILSGKEFCKQQI